MTARAVALLAVLATATGCFGSDRTFPDESAEVMRLYVNAYAETDREPPTRGIVEVSGLGVDGEKRAFEGDLVITLAQQHLSDDGPQYEVLRTWTLAVHAPDFSSPKDALYRHVVDEDEFPAQGTYEARVRASLSTGAAVAGSALFAHPGRAS